MKTLDEIAEEKKLRDAKRALAWQWHQTMDQILDCEARWYIEKCAREIREEAKS